MTGEKLQDVCQLSTNGAGMVHRRERLMGQTDKQPQRVWPEGTIWRLYYGRCVGIKQ